MSVLASKAASFLIVWSMMFSSFAGLIVLGIPGVGQALLPSQLSNGDKVIGADYEISNWAITDRVEYMDGNLTIRSGGVVTITNGGLSFTQDTGPDGIAGTSDDHVYTLIVEDGGMLVLEKSVLTTHLDQLNDFPSLGIIVRNGGALEARNSTLKFPGHMVVDDSTLVMWNATVTGQNATDVETYCNETQFQSDAFDDSPVMLFVSSDVYVYDSMIEGLYENLSAPSVDMYSHDYTFASDNRDRKVVTYNLTRTVGALGAANTALGELLVNLTMDDSRLFTVGTGEELSIDGLDTAGLVFSDSSDVVVTLHAKYKTDAGYAGSNPITWGYNGGSLGSSGIVPADTSSPYGPNEEVTELAVLPRMSSADLNGLNIDFINNGANVYFNRLWVTVEMTIPTYRNLTLAGSTQMTAVNSYVGVDFSNDPLVHNQLVVLDNANAYLYGVSADMSQVAVPSYSRLPAYSTSDISFNATPSAFGATNTAVGESVANLSVNDNRYFNVDNSERMAVDSFNVSDLSGEISSAMLHVIYLTEPGYSTRNYINWSIEGSVSQSTSIRPVNTGTEVLASYDLYGAGVRTLGAIADLNIVFENIGGRFVYFEKVWIELTLRPNIYIYRWLDFKAVDSQSLPVQGAWVNATVSASEAAAYYYTPAGVVDTPPTEVLTYLGRDGTSYKRTDPYGSAMIPLFWEVVNESTMPNSWVLGGYDLNVTYWNATSVLYYHATGVDFTPYPALAEIDQTKEVSVVLSGLVLDKPDLIITALTALPTTVYENDTVTLTATVENNGLTAATNVLVSFADFFGGTLTTISNVTIPFLAGGASTNAVASWSNTRPGVHTVTAKADPLGQIIEESETNNEISIQINVLAFLPELSIVSGDIVIDPQPAYTGMQVFANATIRNTLGRASAINATVEFYVGNPLSGGQLLGSTRVNVPVGGSNLTSFNWIPSQIGEYSIYVYVNRLQTIREYDYTNNLASTSINVELSTNEFDLVVDDNNTISIIGDMFRWRANIVVKDNGTLIVDDVNLVIVQSVANEFQILVKNNGTLILNHAVATSGYSLRLYLFDNASLELNSSVVDSIITVIADDQSKIDMASSTVHSDIIAPITSSVVMTAANTTFTRAWSSFGGSARAYLTSVSIPSLSPVDGAVIHHYRWVAVTVLDGTGAPLSGAFVNLAYYVNGTAYDTAVLGSSGQFTFRALCDKITASSRLYLGNYRLNATFWFGGTPYETDGYTTVSLDPYSAPLVRHDVAVTLTVPNALPDLDPPFWISDTAPARGKVVTLMANVTNIGVVPANNVMVRFYDNGSYIDDVILGVINPGQMVTAETTWTADYPLGAHNLSVMVDPERTIPEWDEANNNNYTIVLVRGIVSLSVTAAGVTLTPASPTTNSSVTVQAVVQNVGDIEAELVNVTFYDTPPGGTMNLIGYSIISRILVNSTGTATVSWTPDLPGSHTLTIMVDEEDLIEEPSKADNTVAMPISVKDYADLVALNIMFRPASPVNVGTHVMMDASLTNIGETAASDVMVRFWLGSVGTGAVIDEVTVSLINSGQTVVATGEWDASVDVGQKLQSRTITIEVNPSEIIPEITYDNNIGIQSILVVDRRPDMMFSGGIEVTSGGHVTDEAVQGESVVIGAQVKNDGYTSAMGVAVAFYVTDSDGLTRYLGTVTKDIASNATVAANLTWAVNVTIGQYNLTVNVNPLGLIEEGNYDNNEIVAQFQVNAPHPIILIDLSNVYKYKAGKEVPVSGTVTNELTGDPLVDVLAWVSLVNSDGIVQGDNVTARTGSAGNFQASKYIIPGQEEGSYTIRVTVQIGNQTFSSSAAITIEKGFVETPTDWWIYAAILIVVAAIIIFFSVYLYKYGLGKMVECGECGALIPESSKRCPKCGVEFEAGTAKCSECGAWIPTNSTECPECGAKFVTAPIPEEEDEYMKKMREQYQQFVDGYREQAKDVLGKKYSEAKFADWWKKQPTYITFEKWLSQEEERRKLGAFACPVCGTLNPRGAKVCHKCGTVFETPKEAPKEEAEEEGKPRLRRIVKRPVEKKVLKKAEEAPAEEKPPEQPGTPPEGESPQGEEPKSP